ncbi:MAG: GNAT family N-acetyltransferase, partial [Micromonosporaceae bacterium]
MDIERLPADERAWRGWHTVWCDGIASDKPDQPPPTWQATRAGLRKPWPGQISEHWVAREGHQIIGAAEIKFPQLDNKDNAWLELMVHPEHRRRGVGSALLARAVERVREDSRKRLMADAVQARPGGEERSGAPAAFAAKHGAKPALEEVRQRLTLPDGPLAGMDDTLADAWRHAGGYSLIRWTEAGAPDDIVAGIAALDSDFLNQAPMGELEWEA